ncbi:lysM and putative peptidoglycan-binding domain-containing protein 4 [Microcaecilia unicolor]|uniref:LysM and putative peptidoglycan-binding domain-containing protein 4 n=1 Tax=Microcaecilia unicolor TaxID=1415580 RepID=A0A6P7WZC8_9AMPH|nr:lysM and putative peptidoglycan-binding domain-containing protein 4 [Microcaecilia unicolor]
MRVKTGSTQTFQAPFTVRISPDSQVYTFRSCRSESEQDSSSEDELDVSELRVRGREQRRSNGTKEKVGDTVLMERLVQKEDNLNKLALQYGCKVADIKRVNNFIGEQDMYALKSVRIPVKIHGVLSETRDELRPLQDSGATLIELPDTDGATGTNESQDLTAYFKGIDQSIREAAQSTEGDFYSVSPGKMSVSQKDFSSGADWGIRWWNAVSILLLIGIVIPVFYIIYFKMQATGLPSNVTSKAFEKDLAATLGAHHHTTSVGNSHLDTWEPQKLRRARTEEHEQRDGQGNALT